jgi:hypothetical protein
MTATLHLACDRCGSTAEADLHAAPVPSGSNAPRRRLPDRKSSPNTA